MRNKLEYVVFVLILAVLGSGPAGANETNGQVQAVDSTGHATYFKVGATPTGANLIVLEGVVLNNPEDMLNGAANFNTIPWNLGGQWQIYIQGQGSDHAGTAAWMGQNYGNMGWINDPAYSYTDAEWNAEMDRLNNLGGHQLRMGDLVRLTGYGLEYNGKSNINERHDNAPSMNFTLEWLGTPGLPAPELITLSAVKDAANQDLFDPTRLTGGEYYQGRLVRINGVHFTGGTWGQDQAMTIADATGRTLLLELGHNPVFVSPSNLYGTFDVVGIFDQDDAYTSGYRLQVMGYDGSTSLLGVVPEPGTGLLLAGGALLCLWRRARRNPSSGAVIDATTPEVKA